jgi:hypothetical protein
MCVQCARSGAATRGGKIIDQLIPLATHGAGMLQMHEQERLHAGMNLMHGLEKAGMASPIPQQIMAQGALEDWGVNESALSILEQVGC